MSELIFEQSHQGRFAKAQAPAETASLSNIPKEFLRTDTPLLPEVSELQVVRHFTKLSKKNFSIDTQFYPLGSCTMKYNPRGVARLALLDGFANHHPLSLDTHSQGFMSCAYELQEILKSITGMQGVS